MKRKRTKNKEEQKSGYSISEPTNIVNDSKAIDMDNEGSRFVVILLSIIAVIGLLFLFSYLKDMKNKKEEEQVKNEIQYSEILVGTMLEQKYPEYYVYAYIDNEGNENDLIDYLINNLDHYYKINLNKAKNAPALAEKSNLKTNNVSEIKFQETTLLLIKDGKIKEAYEGLDVIKDYLRNLSK